jgi:hypothetical protein
LTLQNRRRQQEEVTAVELVLYAVDGLVPSREAAALAHRSLPREAEVQVLEVVPQLPYAWTAWPAFPDTAADLAKAWAYVSSVSHTLEAYGRRVNSKVDFSPLSAAEMGQEILRQAESVRPDLICLALEEGSVIANIVRGAVVPVLIAKCAASEDEPAGRRRSKTRICEPARFNRPLLLNPAGALVFRRAGLL